jgi:hypothetical protein
MRRPSLTLAGFEEWLRKHRPNAVVGHAGFEDDCPLARYLKAIQGKDANVYVWTDHYSVNSREYKLPVWARQFVWELDHSRNLDHSRKGGAPVTAKEAIAILDDVKRSSRS